MFGYLLDAQMSTWNGPFTKFDFISIDIFITKPNAKY